MLSAIGFHLVHKNGRGEMSPDIHAAMAWGRYPGVMVAAHRMFWNVAIWTAPPGLPYAVWANEWKWALLPAILVIVGSSYRVAVLFMPRAMRLRVTVFSIAVVSTSVVVAMLLTPAHHAEGYAERDWSKWIDDRADLRQRDR